MEVIHTIGRRKTAVARIYLKAGNGTITVNKRELNNYFTTPTLQYKVKQALSLVGAEDAYDVKVNVVSPVKPKPFVWLSLAHFANSTPKTALY